MPKNPAQSNKLKTPKLRFPGFDGVWEEKRLGNCLDYQQPTLYIVESTEYDNSYKIPVLTAGKSFILGYTNEENGVYNQNLPVIIFDDFTTTSQFVNFPFKVKSSAMKILTSKEGFNIKFIFEAMQQISYEIGGHGRHWISKYSNIKVLAPSFSEQQKIASFLGGVDAWIENLREQKKSLESYKKGLMQKIFSQQIRFKDEKGNEFAEWEEKRLGNICNIKKGVQLNRDGLSLDTGFPVINGGIDPSGYTDAFNTEGNTITISEGGNSCGYVNFIEENFWSGGHCYSLLDLEADKFFLYQYLKFSQKNIMRLRVGSGLPNIQKKDIERLKLEIPSLPEQQKIAEFLSSADELLESKQQQITNAEEWKKGLMQGLFV